MAFSHGKDSYFNVDNPAGTPTDVSAYCDDVSFPETTDVAETSTFGKASKTYIVGLKDGTISISGNWDPTLDAVFGSQPAAGASRTFIYGPAGSTGGFVKYTGECHMTSYEPSGGIGDAAKFSAEFQVTGDVTRTTF